jgi:hypothetical protein
VGCTSSSLRRELDRRDRSEATVSEAKPKAGCACGADESPAKGLAALPAAVDRWMNEFRGSSGAPAARKSATAQASGGGRQCARTHASRATWNAQARQRTT